MFSLIGGGGGTFNLAQPFNAATENPKGTRHPLTCGHPNRGSVPLIPRAWPRSHEEDMMSKVLIKQLLSVLVQFYSSTLVGKNTGTSRVVVIKPMTLQFSSLIVMTGNLSDVILFNIMIGAIITGLLSFLFLEAFISFCLHFCVIGGLLRLSIFGGMGF